MAKGKFKVKTVPATTNNITKAIIAFLISEGHFACRINRTGIYDPVKKTFRRSGTTSAVFDIYCCLKPDGKSLWVDVKTGKDKPSEDQDIFQLAISKKGGIAIYSKTYQEFIDWYNMRLEYGF